MKKHILILLVAATTASFGMRSSTAGDKALEAKAKITKQAAEKIALAKVPNGKIKEGELEQEKGKLIWSFDIKATGSKDITEVQVDAVTGEVVSVEMESAAAEKAEKKSEKKEKKEKK